jgi:uncharacterized protein (DUF433 family)
VVAQSLAVEELDGQEGALVEEIGVEDLQDVRVRQPGKQPGLAGPSASSRGVRSPGSTDCAGHAEPGRDGPPPGAWSSGKIRVMRRAASGRSLLSRISIDPEICHGKPCIRGHRIWVSLVLDFLAGGASVEELLVQYPGLEEADIRACLAYGAEMSRERYFELPRKRKAA